MSRRVQISLITIACIAVYFGLRSLPVEECEFLHYGEFINSDGVIEGCGYEETEFFDMTSIRFPIIAELVPDSDPTIGEQVNFTLSLFTTTGKAIKWEDIAVSHTERVHAMVVDPSLQDYQHLHPQPAGPEGYYTFSMVPEKAGPYAVYLDFIPMISSRRTLLQTGFEVAGSAGNPQPNTNLTHSANGLQFSFKPIDQSLVTGEELLFELDVKDPDGSPTRFTPVMDSYAHVVAFDESGAGFAHMHPQNPFVEGQDPLNPDLTFTFKFDKPGYYRVWAQLVVNEQHLFVPFDLMIDG